MFISTLTYYPNVCAIRFIILIVKCTARAITLTTTTINKAALSDFPARIRHSSGFCETRTDSKFFYKGF